MIDLDRAMPGYETTEFLDPHPETVGWTADQWEDEFHKTRNQIVAFLDGRDPFAILARTAARLIVESGQAKKIDRLEQPHLEIIQSLFLLLGKSKHRVVPASPRNLERLWSLVDRNTRAFVHKNKNSNSEIRNIVANRARVQTVYYRNIFSRADCEQVLLGILTKIDPKSEDVLGYRLSDVFRAMVRITDIVGDRLRQFAEHVAGLVEAKSVQEMLPSVEFFRSAYPLAEKIWSSRALKVSDKEKFRYAAFQVSECAYPWVFSISRAQLSAEFSPDVIEALFSLSITPGCQSDCDPEHIYLDNLIWKRPYIRHPDGLFVPLPQLVFSFPFAIIEWLIGDHQELDRAYESARSGYLEDAVADTIRHAIPSAQVHQGVSWTDPKTNQIWENDVVAVVGNFLFVFEAKSGRIKDASRRGASLSLEKNFRELFVAPGLQGWRLQSYLDQHRLSAKLRRKSDGDLINISLDRPKVVYRFSICIEHFASLTSAKHYFKKLGLVTNETAWAPVLSLGELQMISRYLDSEASFIHYLTRRATLEEMIDFDGDEQDLLSLYLTNGLCIDPSGLDGRRVIFHNADGNVRQNKVPRVNREEFEIHGVQLSSLWEQICKELYFDSSKHKFDINSVVLNQLPPALFEFERRIRRFRRGVPHGGEDFLIVKFVVGKKAFVLAVYLAKKMPPAEEWRETGHNLSKMFLNESETVDCAAFIFLRKSKQNTFDGVSFYRSGRRSEPVDV